MAARIQAYDVHVDTEKGHVHFQVLVDPKTEIEDVLKHAKTHLEVQGYSGDLVNEKNCIKLGHDQGDQGGQRDEINDVGYAILKVHPT